MAMSLLLGGDENVLELAGGLMHNFAGTLKKH